MSKILKESTKRRREHQALDNWKRLEHQAPGDQLLQKTCQLKRQFIFIQILMERGTFGSSTILQRSSSLRARRSTNWSTFDQSSAFAAQRCDLEPIYVRMFIHFILADNGSRRLRKDGDEKKFPGTQDLIQSGQRQLKVLIDRQDAYNMQILRDWNTIRWSRTSSLSDPAAKLICMKVYVFSDSTLCVGVSNSDPSNDWATKVGRCMARPWICGTNEFGSPRSAIQLARTRCFYH